MRIGSAKTHGPKRRGPNGNLRLQALDLWRFYSDRAGVELPIRHLKETTALHKINRLKP